MESKIARALNLTHEPVAIIWTDERPDRAVHFKKGGNWGCVMWLFAGAARGKTAVIDRETYGCVGGGVGLGFGNQYDCFPGSLECFCHFLSRGNEHFELGRKIAPAVGRVLGKAFAQTFLSGERFMKSPEQVKKFLEQLPMIDIANRYVLLKPLRSVHGKEKPQVISFVVNSHQLSALTTLCSYEGGNLCNVIIPTGAACHQIGIFPYREAASEQPRAVVGLTDLFARARVRKQLGDDIMTFSVPFTTFEGMEGNVEGSFLEGKTWELLKKQIIGQRLAVGLQGAKKVQNP